MSTEIWLVGVAKSSCICIQGMWVCMCIWEAGGFSVLSTYFTLYVLPSVTLSLCKYSLQFLIAQSSSSVSLLIYPISTTACVCWRSLYLDFITGKLWFADLGYWCTYFIQFDNNVGSQAWWYSNLSFLFSRQVRGPYFDHTTATTSARW